MRRQLKTSGPTLRSTEGFTLIELLVLVVLLGLMGTIGIMSFFFLVRRARVQSVAMEAAGWIENVRNHAANRVDADPDAGGCGIIFARATTTSPLVAGNTLAQVDRGCRATISENILRVPTNLQQGSIAVNVCQGTATSSPANCSSNAPSDLATFTESDPADLTFTPRGLWIDRDGDYGDYLFLTIRLQAGFGAPALLRCVRLTPTLGSVSIGRPPNSAGTQCTQWQEI